MAFVVGCFLLLANSLPAAHISGNETPAWAAPNGDAGGSISGHADFIVEEYRDNAARVSLTGYVWAKSTNVSPALSSGESFSLTVESENFRIKPQGEIIARFTKPVRFTLLEREGNWVHAIATAWISVEALDRLPEPTSSPAASVTEGPSASPSPSPSPLHSAVSALPGEPITPTPVPSVAHEVPTGPPPEGSAQPAPNGTEAPAAALLEDIRLYLLILTAMLPMLALGLFVLWRASRRSGLALESWREGLDRQQERIERAVRAEATQSRIESGNMAGEQRRELSGIFQTFRDSVLQQMRDGARSHKELLEAFSGSLSSFTTTSDQRLVGLRAESAKGAKELREEVMGSLRTISDTISKTMGDLGGAQQERLEAFNEQLRATIQSMVERLEEMRSASAAAEKQLREEVATTLTRISATIAATMRESAAAERSQREEFSSQMAAATKANGEKLDIIRTESMNTAKQLREEIRSTLQGINESNSMAMASMSAYQRTQLDTMASEIGKLSDTNDRKLEAVRAVVEAKLQGMRDENVQQLERMRQTVDEKLHGTLEKRLGESFKQVSDRLEQVHKGLGEMQTLATGVGDLKKVLTNVKTRGTWGETQLGALLEQVLTADQYSSNVPTKNGSERVEFAVRLPGQGAGSDQPLWLPIDAKFPIEDYQRLIEAQEDADTKNMEAAGKKLESRVKACAKDIADKYLNPPCTTDFAILFLPLEGLFAEVIRRTGLIETIQREYRVVVAGPTTLWSILSSLQMGFRTLAIQKRSSEVWKLLASVKTEWMKYAEAMDGVQKKFEETTRKFDEVKKRSRAVGRSLKDVQESPTGDAVNAVNTVTIVSNMVSPTFLGDDTDAPEDDPM